MQSGVEVVSFHIIECPHAIGSKSLQRATVSTDHLAAFNRLKSVSRSVKRPRRKIACKRVRAVATRDKWGMLALQKLKKPN